MLFHAVDGITLPDFTGDVQDTVDQMVGLQYDGTVWDTAEYALAGSSIFNPLTDWTPITSTSGADPNDNSDPAKFLQFGGRGLGDGVRVKLYLYETYALPNQRMRYLPGEFVAVDAVITELASVDNELGTVSGSLPIWKTYANINSNDHLVHKARS